ncbi:hypothetical protein HHI36_012624 [Cryptolaemus montrouzieri]|uniref:UPF3 domain-containing protein n=1 Tax=Cryptolaemus montrouzieri TaxID=559131 RepID=A0ABD2NF97_9CUCU
MAFPEEGKAISVKPGTNNQSQKADKREKPLTKVVIRRLPPTINKETFLNQISPVPPYDYFYLVNGEAALGENSFARAYINFVSPNDVFDFKEKFDNYVFLDHKGNEYAAVVEFAAFQKIPKKRNKVRVDPKCGSIESDPYYLEFMENLNKPIEQEDKPEYSYQFLTEIKDGKDSITTPLLEFVKNRRVERMRIREERREERRRKELERKKVRDEERKKRFEEKSPTKVFSKNKTEDKEHSDAEIKEEKRDNYDNKHDKNFEKTNSFRNKDRRFEDRKKDIKAKPSPRKEYPDKKEYKGRKEFFKESKFDYKKEDKQFPKKVKKYSEKREERKMEAQKAEMKKAEEESKAALIKESKDKKSKESEDKVINSTKAEVNKKESEEKIDSILTKPEKESSVGNLDKQEAVKNQEKEIKISQKDKDYSNAKDSENRDSDSKCGESREARRERIRNKDRPTIAIYRPGMLSKRKLAEGDAEKETSKDSNKESK